MGAPVIALFLLQATLGAIGQQALPTAGCAAYLWSVGERPQLLAMAAAAAAAQSGMLRITLDGTPLDLPRTAGDAGAAMGLAGSTRYAAGAVSETLELTVSERPALANGAVVSAATLTLERAGQDVVVTPLAGMIGCGQAHP